MSQVCWFCMGSGEQLSGEDCTVCGGGGFERARSQRAIPAGAIEASVEKIAAELEAEDEHAQHVGIGA